MTGSGGLMYRSQLRRQLWPLQLQLTKPSLGCQSWRCAEIFLWATFHSKACLDVVELQEHSHSSNGWHAQTRQNINSVCHNLCKSMCKLQNNGALQTLGWGLMLQSWSTCAQTIALCSQPQHGKHCYNGTRTWLVDGYSQTLYAKRYFHINVNSDQINRK